ncbi:MAG: helix-turn-helix transcriptional regulator [Bacilli bacterium]|jgi:transcriptional regulator with XRE-family HTH domain|nr:helix-turn-helix transcriptional regulator [Bacilli bacterium]
MNLSNIYAFRIENNITQKEIIQYLNISKGTYSAWESGQDIIPLKRLNDLCNYLNISIDYALQINNKCYDNSKKEIDKTLLQKRLKDIRKENNLTLKDLALKFNTSPSVLSRYENGQTIILVPFLVSYAKLFNISVDYLLGKIDEPKFLK